VEEIKIARGQTTLFGSAGEMSSHGLSRLRTDSRNLAGNDIKNLLSFDDGTLAISGQSIPGRARDDGGTLEGLESSSFSHKSPLQRYSSPFFRRIIPCRR
jgi:hypothetical protein